MLLAINGLRAPWLDAVLDPIGEWALYAVPLGLIGWALRRRDRGAGRAARDGALAFLTSLFVAESILKPLIARPRPTAVPELLERLDVLGATPSARSLSMPSGTACACAAGAAFVLARFGPRAATPAIALAILAGFARIYAGVHWPSDVLAGLMIGAAVGFGADRLARALESSPPRGARST